MKLGTFEFDRIKRLGAFEKDWPFKSGDVIEAEIEGIGVLRNPVEGIEVDQKYAQQIHLEDIV